MRNKRLILVLGAAGTGKDSLVNRLLKETNIKPAISFTTRDRRSGEREGVTYHYISEEEFKSKLQQGQIVEHTSYNIQSENRIYTYGLTEEELNSNENVITIVNPHGLRTLQTSKFKDNIVTILIDCNDRERLIRYLQRDEKVNVEEAIDRYYRDKRDFKESGLTTDYIIYNDGDFEDAYREFKKIVLSEMVVA